MAGPTFPKAPDSLSFRQDGYVVFDSVLEFPEEAPFAKKPDGQTGIYGVKQPDYSKPQAIGKGLKKIASDLFDINISFYGSFYNYIDAVGSYFNSWSSVWNEINVNNGEFYSFFNLNKFPTMEAFYDEKFTPKLNDVEAKIIIHDREIKEKLDKFKFFADSAEKVSSKSTPIAYEWLDYFAHNTWDGNAVHNYVIENLISGRQTLDYFFSSHNSFLPVDNYYNGHGDNKAERLPTWFSFMKAWNETNDNLTSRLNLLDTKVGNSIAITGNTYDKLVDQEAIIKAISAKIDALEEKINKKNVSLAAWIVRCISMLVVPLLCWARCFEGGGQPEHMFESYLDSVPCVDDDFSAINIQGARFGVERSGDNVSFKCPWPSHYGPFWPLGTDIAHKTAENVLFFSDEIPLNLSDFYYPASSPFRPS